MGLRVLGCDEGCKAIVYESVSGIPLLTPVFDDRDYFDSAISAANEFVGCCQAVMVQRRVSWEDVTPEQLAGWRDSWEASVADRLRDSRDDTRRERERDAHDARVRAGAVLDARPAR
jgi:hypothetical protein